MQVHKAALAALAIHAGVVLPSFAAPRAAVLGSASPRIVVTQLEPPRGDADLPSRSLIESNRGRLPMEDTDAPRFVPDDDANLDELILGGLLSRVRGLDDNPANQPLTPLPFGATDGEELDRFSLAGAESLPEIGIDEDDIGPGDVVLVLGGMFAIGALIFRLHKGGTKVKPLFKRRHKKTEIMSDSDFYPI